MSTISPIVSQKVGAALAQKGVKMLDAPVSGSVTTLEEGRLSIVVGGDPDAFELARPILEDIGPKVTHGSRNGVVGG